MKEEIIKRLNTDVKPSGEGDYYHVSATLIALLREYFEENE